jgi:hypothetical protein
MIAVLLSMLAIAAYLVLCYLTGRMLVALIWTELPAPTIAGLPVLGAGVLAGQLWVYGLAHIPWNLVTLLLPWLVLGAATRSRFSSAFRSDLRRTTVAAREDWARLDSLSVVLVVVGIVIAFTYVLNLVTEPLTGFDAFANWLYKAKVFYLSGAVNEGLLVLPGTGDPGGLGRSVDIVLHREYPPLFPTMVATIYVIIGRPDGLTGKAINVLFLASSAVAVYTMVRSMLGARWAVVFGFLAVSLPTFAKALYTTDYMGYADFAVGACMLLGLVNLHLGVSGAAPVTRALAAILAVEASLVKDEGVVFLVAVLLVLCMFVLRPAWSEGRRGIQRMSSLLPYSLILLPVVGWKLWVRAAGFQQEHVPSPSDLVQRLPDLPSNAIRIVSDLRPSLTLHSDFGWLAIAIALSLALLMTDRTRYAMLASVVVYLQLLGYWLAWLYSPRLDFIVISSYERLAIQLAPMLLVLLAIGLCRYVGAGKALAAGRSSPGPAGSEG